MSKQGMKHTKKYHRESRLKIRNSQVKRVEVVRHLGRKPKLPI